MTAIFSPSASRQLSAVELLAVGEAAFDAGDHARARDALAMVLDHPAATARERAEAQSDLGIIAFCARRTLEAERHLLAAVAEDPTCEAALENLSGFCREQGDLVQASHWAERWTAVRPDVAEAWLALGTTLSQRRRGRAAAAALSEASRLGVGTPGPRPAALTRGSCGPAAGSASIQATVTRVLIVVDYFHPSMGGSERLAEAAGVALMQQGMAIGVATRALPTRDAVTHRGMTIHEIAAQPVTELDALVRDHGYEALLVFAGPTTWPIAASLRLSEPSPRTIVVPCINDQNAAELAAEPTVLASYAEALARADVTVVSSLSGADVRLAELLGHPTVYVPNASEEPVADPSSPIAELTGAGPVVLMVANLWPEKNHVGLLSHLATVPGPWQLALIGSAADPFPELARQVAHLAAGDERVTLLGPAQPGAIAAAMDDAELLVLPSVADATPIVLLEAMSRRLPWLATPSCGAANDHSGGFIAPLDRFGDAITFLLQNPDARRTLGEAGRAHWEAAYRWSVIGPRYAQLLRGETLPELAPPTQAIRLTDAVRARFYDARVTAAASAPG